jgi:hypothetical protein
MSLFRLGNSLNHKMHLTYKYKRPGIVVLPFVFVNGVHIAPILECLRPL